MYVCVLCVVYMCACTCACGVCMCDMYYVYIPIYTYVHKIPVLSIVGLKLKCIVACAAL